MKFAAVCGRTDLSKELSKSAPHLDIQNYMALIQSAGRDKDIKRAFEVVDLMKSSGLSVDVAVYSCVLDVCVLAGDLERARQLLSEMQQKSLLDVVAYNTLLKGYCNAGDNSAAVALLAEMEEVGLAPNDVSFNCMINMAAATGNFKEAWSLTEMMQRRGLKIGNFTMSILMKALKKTRSPHTNDIAKAFALLDLSGVDMHADEAVLNTVMESCMRHRELKRLETIVEKYMSSNPRPSLQTCGLLIKAYSSLNQLAKCRMIWEDLITKRSLTPNDWALGYMLDALVNNDHIDEAISLLNKWERTLPPSTYTYGTILKGLANSNQSDRAMEVYANMKEKGIRISTFIFTTLIDMQARIGAIDQVSKLVRDMQSMGYKSDDYVASSTIMKAYIVNGDIEEAFQAFRGMQKSGLACDSDYNSILEGAIRVNRMDLADVVVEDLKESNARPSNHTLCTLMKMYGRRRQVQKSL
jgi:pentatricopeptide repeat protein